MAANDFPTIATPAFPISRETEDPAIRSTFENGTEQTRARFTRTRTTWTLHWPAMSNADRDTLRTFWDTVHGGSDAFDFIDPYDSGVTVEARFAGPIKETWRDGDHWEIEITVKEI
jgi:hypothetical protein